MTTDVKLLYVTCKDDAEARSIGTALVTERLAACVNIFPHMESIYMWKDALESSRESVMIVKTTVALALKCSERIRGIHSYEVPCILELDIQNGDPRYLAWVKGSVSS